MYFNTTSSWSRSDDSTPGKNGEPSKAPFPSQTPATPQETNQN